MPLPPPSPPPASAQDALPDALPACCSGSADLAFAVRHGRTRLVKSRLHPPLAVQRAMYLDDLLPGMAFVFLANPTAGIFQGDRQRIAVEVQPGARAHVTNQSASKIHAMPDSSAAQDTSLAVADNAYLEYLPEPLIPFRGSRFRQETRITVSDTGTLLYADIIAPGRVARGEALDCDWLETRLTVARPGGGPLYHEAYRLEPRASRPRTAVVLGEVDAPTLGSLLIVTGIIAAPELAASLRGVINPTTDGGGGIGPGGKRKIGLDAGEETGPGMSIGATCLPGNCGVGIKVIGPETQAVKAALTRLASAARRLLIGAPLPPSRKY